MQDRSTTDRAGPPGWTLIAWLLLTAGLLAPIGSLAGPATEPAVCSHADPSCGQASPLDQLARTIGKLKTSLSAIRQDLEAAADQVPQAPVDRLCGAGPLAEAQAARDAAVSELEQARATAAGEPAAAEAEVARLTGDRAPLLSPIVGPHETLAPNVRDPAAAAAGAWQTSPIPSAEAAEVESIPQSPLLPLPADTPSPVRAVAGDRASASADRLQLQAELALAQLKIAELSTALESARLRQEAMAAEVSALRSLTDAKIRQFLGWH